MVESPPASSGDTDLIPGLETKILHAAGQLSLRATTTGACVLCNKRRHHSEKPEHRKEEWPLLAATRESLCSATAVYGVARSRTRLSNFTFTFHFHALEKEMATHSSILAWRIPGTGEPGGLPSMGSHRVGHN